MGGGYGGRKEVIKCMWAVGCRAAAPRLTPCGQRPATTAYPPPAPQARRAPLTPPLTPSLTPCPCLTPNGGGHLASHLDPQADVARVVAHADKGLARGAQLAGRQWNGCFARQTVVMSAQGCRAGRRRREGRSARLRTRPQAVRGRPRGGHPWQAGRLADTIPTHGRSGPAACPRPPSCGCAAPPWSCAAPA